MNKIITISREFGSGGRELGRKLANHLDIPYYDQEILAQIAQKTQLAEDYVQKVMDTEAFFHFPITVGRSFNPVRNVVLEQNNSIFIEQHNIITDMAKRSDCVIVGRCSDYILREYNPLRIFVYAAPEHKMERCRRRDEKEAALTDKELKKNISNINQDRARYYKFYTGQEWGNKNNYDICINTSNLSIDHIVKAFSGLIS